MLMARFFHLQRGKRKLGSVAQVGRNSKCAVTFERAAGATLFIRRANAAAIGKHGRAKLKVRQTRRRGLRRVNRSRGAVRID